MVVVYLNIPRGDRRNIVRATSADALLNKLTSANKHEEYDRDRLFCGRTIVFTTLDAVNWEPTHVLVYDRVEISTGVYAKASPALYAVTNARKLEGQHYRCTAELCGLATALMRGGDLQVHLDRASLPDTVVSTTPEQFSVSSVVEDVVYKDESRMSEYVPVVTVTRRPGRAEVTTPWERLNYATDMTPIAPCPLTCVLCDEDGPLAGEGAYQWLTWYLSTIGSNIDYVIRVQFIPAFMLDGFYSFAPSFIISKTGASHQIELWAIDGSYTGSLLQTSHNAAASASDNKKAYYTGEYRVYNKGSLLSRVDGPYMLQTGTQLLTEITAGAGGAEARLVVRQTGTTDLYVPLMLPDTAVILDAYGTKEQDAARNVWQSIIAGAIGGAVSGPKGSLTGAAAAYQGSAGNYVHTVFDAARQDLTVGASAANYAYDASPYLLVTWSHPYDRTQLRDMLRKRGYTCSVESSGLPAYRTVYNAYTGSAVYTQPGRNSDSGFSGVGLQEIRDALNEELGEGVIVYEAVDNVGKTQTVGNP